MRKLYNHGDQVKVLSVTPIQAAQGYEIGRSYGVDCDYEDLVYLKDLRNHRGMLEPFAPNQIKPA